MKTPTDCLFHSVRYPNQCVPEAFTHSSPHFSMSSETQRHSSASFWIWKTIDGHNRNRQRWLFVLMGEWTKCQGVKIVVRIKNYRSIVEEVNANYVSENTETLHHIETDALERRKFTIRILAKGGQSMHPWPMQSTDQRTHTHPLFRTELMESEEFRLLVVKYSPSLD